MRRFLQTFCFTLIVLGIPTYGTASEGEELNQTPKPSIENFRVVDVSSGELRVTVDYTFPGAVQDKVIIHATPREKDGFHGLTVNFDEVAVQSGTHTVTLGITKNSTGPVFTSVVVGVCISNPDGAILCKEFPYEKTWTNSAAQMCSISGHLTGPLEGLSYPDHAGPPSRVTLRQMIVESPDGKRTASITNRNYTFSNLLEGVTYTVFPSGFDSVPSRKTLQCRSNFSHRVDFRIIRPTSQG